MIDKPGWALMNQIADAYNEGRCPTAYVNGCSQSVPIYLKGGFKALEAWAAENLIQDSADPWLRTHSWIKKWHNL